MTKRYGLLLCGLCRGTSDVKVLDRLVCIGAFDNQVLSVLLSVCGCISVMVYYISTALPSLYQ